MTIEEYLPEWFGPTLLSEQAKQEIAVAIADGFLYGTGGFHMSPDWETNTLKANRINPLDIRISLR